MTPTPPPATNQQRARDLLDTECPGHPEFGVSRTEGEWQCNCEVCLRQALDAAEQRGRQQEREACLDIAKCFDNDNEFHRNGHLTARSIVQAIRQGQRKEEAR